MPLSLERLKPDMSVTRNMRFLGGLAAFLFAMAIPFLYFCLSTYALNESLKVETAYLAKDIEKIIHDRPDMWEIRQERLMGIISRPPIKGGMDERTIRTVEGKVVVKTDFTATGPAITVSVAVLDPGHRIGSLEARHSILEQVFIAALLGMVSSYLGYLLFITFRRYLIRMLENVLTDLHEAQEKERRNREAAERNREAAERLTRGIEIIAEIGKVVGSTLDIEEVYIWFAVETKKLIPFDRLSVNLHNLKEKNVKVAYTIGETVPGRSKGDLFPLKGSTCEVLSRTRAGLYNHVKNAEELRGAFASSYPSVKAGMRSLLRVPLIYRDDVIGSLHFGSKAPDAYTDRDLRMAERIGAQIAGAIANAQLYADLRTAQQGLKESEARFRGVAEETAVIAEIGRVISSTLDINDVYERFAAEAKKLIHFDRLSVNLHDLDNGILRPVYVSGLQIDGQQPGDTFPMKGSVSEVLVRTKAGIFSHPSSAEEMDKRFPDHVATIKAGMRSLLSVPLISRGRVIASLHFRARRPNVYNEKDLRLAERIGEQIAGAIANAQLYASRKKAEKELKESEQRYRELSIVDDLTQLYNSRHFYFHLKIELDRTNRYEQPLTLLLLDLDNFKAFNDAYGHIEGDQVLIRLGQVVKRCLRETDFAYRYGGEEFTILLPMTTSVDGAVTAERIRTEFRKEAFYPVSGQEVHVTVSIGLAQYRMQEEMRAFVHRVDQLMYQGKKNGKDRVCSESLPQ